MQSFFQTQSKHVHTRLGHVCTEHVQAYFILHTPEDSCRRKNEDKLLDFDEIIWGIDDGTPETLKK